MAPDQSTTPPERWLPVPGWEGLYSVSDLGRVRSEARPTRHRPRMLKPVLNQGYLYVNLSRGGRGRSPQWAKISRLVLTVFSGPCQDGQQCRHLDGDPMNNRLDNLAWGTQTENEADKRRHGRLRCGERNRQAKLTEAQVRLIRERLAAGDMHKEIARLVGVFRTTVSAIAQGKTWKHV